MTERSVLRDGIYFGEGPRWRNGHLYLSDFYAQEVLKVDPAGKRESIATVPNQPSGLGWLPDGTMLIVSMKDRKLLKLTEEGLIEHADLSSVAGYHCNDMVVSDNGRAYVGNFGYNHYEEPVEKTANLARVDPDGSVHCAAPGLRFPNTGSGPILVPTSLTASVLTRKALFGSPTRVSRRPSEFAKAARSPTASQPVNLVPTPACWVATTERRSISAQRQVRALALPKYAAAELNIAV